MNQEISEDLILFLEENSSFSEEEKKLSILDIMKSSIPEEIIQQSIIWDRSPRIPKINIRKN